MSLLKLSLSDDEMVSKFNKFTVLWNKSADISKTLRVWYTNDTFFTILAVTDQDIRISKGWLPPPDLGSSKEA